MKDFQSKKKTKNTELDPNPQNQETRETVMRASSDPLHFSSSFTGRARWKALRVGQLC